jgi:pantoate--beta-alanine ligase
MTYLAQNRQELRQYRQGLSGVVGLVPTMGALHAGHGALIEQARKVCDRVVVSVFVNPMQFNQAADLERYPRDLDMDMIFCQDHRVDLVWAPTYAEVYTGGAAQVWVTAGEIANQLEGPNRPGHFDGVLTVVLKLFSQVKPNKAFFGEKDYQQLTLIRRMALDLDLPVEIDPVPTVREPDGLALSSRNVFLSPDERRRALVLSRALFSGQAAGPKGADAVLAAAHAELGRSSDDVAVEYLELRGPDLGAVPEHGAARLLVAAKVGATRLIDNVAVELG